VLVNWLAFGNVESSWEPCEVLAKVVPGMPEEFLQESENMLDTETKELILSILQVKLQVGGLRASPPRRVQSKIFTTRGKL
jgi:hypothetical protein